mgnify:CR=1 FL=1
MRILTVILLSLFTITASSAQMMGSEESDPQATKILDKLKSEYDGYSSMEIDFNLIMEIPGQEEENQKGNVIRQADKYKLSVGDRVIFSNGDYIWLYIGKNNEVQINDADLGDDSEDMISPTNMLQMYESGDFVYAITDEPFVDGRKLTKIDFKPLDKDTEYSKIALFVDTRENDIKQIKIFSKDGSRYTLQVNGVKSNEKYASDVFEFNSSDYPGVHIEDLRID